MWTFLFTTNIKDFWHYSWVSGMISKLHNTAIVRRYFWHKILWNIVYIPQISIMSAYCIWWQEVLGFDIQKVFAIISIKLIFIYLSIYLIFFVLSSNHNILMPTVNNFRQCWNLENHYEESISITGLLKTKKSEHDRKN